MCGCGDVLLVNKVGDEVVDLRHTHFARMALLVVEDVLPHPGDVGLFSAKGVVTVAKDFAILVEQFLPPWGRVRFRKVLRL